MLEVFDKILLGLHNLNDFGTAMIIMIYVGFLVKNAVLKMTGHAI